MQGTPPDGLQCSVTSAVFEIPSRGPEYNRRTLLDQLSCETTLWVVPQLEVPQLRASPTRGRALRKVRAVEGLAATIQIPSMGMGTFFSLASCKTNCGARSSKKRIAMRTNERAVGRRREDTLEGTHANSDTGMPGKVPAPEQLSRSGKGWGRKGAAGVRHPLVPRSCALGWPTLSIPTGRGADAPSGPRRRRRPPLCDETSGEPPRTKNDSTNFRLVRRLRKVD